MAALSIKLVRPLNAVLCSSRQRRSVGHQSAGKAARERSAQLSNVLSWNEPWISIWSCQRNRSKDDATSKRSRNITLYLLGTCHASRKSEVLAERLVRHVQPDAVFVEMDEERFPLQLIDDHTKLDSSFLRLSITATSSRSKETRRRRKNPKTSTSSSTNSKQKPKTSRIIVPVLSPKHQNLVELNRPSWWVTRVSLSAYFFGLAFTGMLRHEWRKLIHGGYGNESVAALTAGKQVGADLILGDRDMDATTERWKCAWAMDGFRREVPTLDNEDDDDSHHHLLTRAYVSDYNRRSKQHTPHCFQIITAERDEYMATILNSPLLLDNNDDESSYQTVTAVFGMAHMDGIEAHLKQWGWKQQKQQELKKQQPRQ